MRCSVSSRWGIRRRFKKLREHHDRAGHVGTHAGEPRALIVRTEPGRNSSSPKKTECFRHHGGINVTGTTDCVGKGISEVAFHSTGFYNILHTTNTMKTSSRRAIIAVVLAAVPAVFVVQNTAIASPAPTIARFHLALSKSAPAANDTAAAPKSIQLWFTEPVKVSATGVQLTGPDKKVVPTGPVTIAAAAKSPAVAEISETLRPGTYTVEWRTMAEDGHPNKGAFVFTVGTKAAK